MFQFPPSPTPNQTFTPVAGVTYRWSGTAWHLIAGPGAFLTAADADTRYVNIDEAQNTTNRIINGKMAIDQRNAGAAVTMGGGGIWTYGLDRWAGYSDSTGRFTMERFLSNPGEYRLRAVVTTAIVHTAANSTVIFHRIEGYNVADLQLGTATASLFTVAFEAYSPTVTGTFGLAFRNANATRSYVATFSLAAGVVKQISVTVPGDTTGTWLDTNGDGLIITIALGNGPSGFAPSANTWAAGNFLTVAGCVNMMATVNNQLYIGNFRLYKGSVDFGPDRRLYAEELALCQRYYCKSYGMDVVPGALTIAGARAMVTQSASTYSGVANVNFPVRMRAVPTITTYSGVTGASGVWGGAAGANVATVVEDVSDNCMWIANNATVAAGNILRGHYTASAEL